MGEGRKLLKMLVGEVGWWFPRRVTGELVAGKDGGQGWSGRFKMRLLPRTFGALRRLMVGRAVSARNPVQARTATPR